MYNIVLSERARQQIQHLLFDKHDEYTPFERMEYVSEIEAVIISLDKMPERFAEFEISGRLYRRVSIKAHSIFYRVDQADKTVFVDAILHSRANFKKWL